jgi:hypothetical protein
MADNIRLAIVGKAIAAVEGAEQQTAGSEMNERKRTGGTGNRSHLPLNLQSAEYMLRAAPKGEAGTDLCDPFRRLEDFDFKTALAQRNRRSQAS